MFRKKILFHDDCNPRGSRSKVHSRFRCVVGGKLVGLSIGLRALSRAPSGAQLRTLPFPIETRGVDGAVLRAQWRQRSS